MFVALVSPPQPLFHACNAARSSPGRLSKKSFVRFNMRYFVVRLAASRPKEPTPLAKEIVRSTCSKSNPEGLVPQKMVKFNPGLS